jgi:uncharacterized protein (DUF305 family)
MKSISIPLAAALLVISSLAGMAAGYALTPEYRLTMYDRSEMDLGRPDRWLDRRYLDAMIAHHRGAVLLAGQLKEHTKRPELEDLAQAILDDEPAAIAELYAWKRDWYGDTRAVKDPAVPNLGRNDDTFDLRFLNALIAHHESGLGMTREIRSKSSRTEVLNNADTVEAFLTKTLPVLKGWRMDWYGL